MALFPGGGGIGGVPLGSHDIESCVPPTCGKLVGKYAIPFDPIGIEPFGSYSSYRCLWVIQSSQITQLDRSDRGGGHH